MQNKVADMRKDYSQDGLSETDMAADPIRQFENWWKEVLTANIDEPNAMILATASTEAVPSARIVLMKDFSEKGFVFFSNYNSFKGQQLTENPKACLVFFWKELERQVRITGLVMKLNDKESDEYFYSRPQASQISACVSPQSQVIKDRNWLDEQFRKFETETKNNIRRPPHWGGYLVKPVIIEFWQGRPNRLHDRIQYTLQDDGSWKIERLAP